MNTPRAPYQATSTSAPKEQERAIQKFCKICVWIYETWITYRTVFDDDRRWKCTDWGKNIFFIQRFGVILKEHLLLQMMKLHDPAFDRRTKRLNLTFDYVVNKCKWGKRTSKRLKILLAKIEATRMSQAIKEARNRTLCHNDIETLLHDTILGAFPKDHDKEYFNLLNKFLTIIYQIIQKGRFVWFVEAGDMAKSDAESFLATLCDSRPSKVYGLKMMASGLPKSNPARVPHPVRVGVRAGSREAARAQFEEQETSPVRVGSFIKEQREQFILESFIKKVGLDATVERHGHPETEPDFFILIDGEKVGIELTELFRGRQDNRAGKKKISLSKKCEAENQRTLASLERSYKSLCDVQIAVDFIAPLPAGIKDQEAIVRRLIEIAQQIKDGDPRRPYALASGVKGFVSRVRKDIPGVSSRWRIADAGWVKRITAAMIEDIILPKCAKLEKYKTHARKIFLLIHTDRRRQSGMISGDMLLEGGAIDFSLFGFDAIFLYTHPLEAVRLYPM